jgi:hypothetical protein
VQLGILRSSALRAGTKKKTFNFTRTRGHE